MQESYQESAGFIGQNNRDVAQYADLGDGLRAATIDRPIDAAWAQASCHWLAELESFFREKLKGNN